MVKIRAKYGVIRAFKNGKVVGEKMWITDIEGFNKTCEKLYCCHHFRSVINGTRKEEICHCASVDFWYNNNKVIEVKFVKDFDYVEDSLVDEEE